RRARAEHHAVRLQERARNCEHFLRRFARTKNHFGKTATLFAIGIHARKSEIDVAHCCGCCEVERIKRSGIIFESTNPWFLKNRCDSSLRRSVNKVMRWKSFCFAYSIAYC